jgi:hypothetical protein
MAVPPPAAELAWKELELAQKNASNASPVEQALIDALAKRYANPQPEDRSGLDRGYADAMREVWKKYPKDPDVGALFAEAMMNLRPWDQWTPDGKPQPGTDEIIATLDAVLKLNPNHPLANHSTFTRWKHRRIRSVRWLPRTGSATYSRDLPTMCTCHRTSTFAPANG